MHFWLYVTMLKELIVWTFFRLLLSFRRPCHNYLGIYWAYFFQVSVVACRGPYAQIFLNFLEQRVFFLRLTMSAKRMKRKCVPRPSSRRPSVASIISEPTAWILSNFACCFPWAIWLDIFLNVWKKKYENVFFWNVYEYFSFPLTWGPMGSKISKRYSYKLQPKVFKRFLIFLLNSPHKTIFRIFEILKTENLTMFVVFVNMGPNGSEDFNTLLILQIADKFFHTCPEFSSQWFSQNYFGGFEILRFR